MEHEKNQEPEKLHSTWCFKLLRSSCDICSKNYKLSLIDHRFIPTPICEKNENVNILQVKICTIYRSLLYLINFVRKLLVCLDDPLDSQFY